MDNGLALNLIYSQGGVTIPAALLDHLEEVGITSSDLGQLVFGLKNQGKTKDQLNQQLKASEKQSVRWCLDNGWAVWEGDSQCPQLSFVPLWNRFGKVLELKTADKGVDNGKERNPDSFDYSRIVKELEKLKGCLGLTAAEKRFIQELNIKYGWPSDFIVTFYRLCYDRGLKDIKNYRPLAQSLNRSGVLTIDGLISYMDEVDWIRQKAQEIKKDYLGLYGALTITERDLYVKWNIGWKMSQGVIEFGAQQTVGATNATFKYLDSILENWHKNGVTNIEEAREYLKQREALKEDKKNLGPKNTTGRKKTSSGWDDYLS